MPVPVYIISSESGATDELTNLVSFFNLIEKLQIARIQIGPGQSAIINNKPMQVTAVWLKEDSDPPEAKYQVQFVAVLPNAPAESKFAEGEIQFGADPLRPLQRITITGIRIGKFFGPGIMRIEARIRRSGEEEWINRQSYPIILEEIQPPNRLSEEPQAGG